jgi:glutamate transport system substrate-binding protein
MTSNWRKSITAVSVTLMLVLVGAAACTEQATPKETVESLRAKSPTLANKARLRIAVREDVPYLFYFDPQTKVRSGFEIEIARAMAQELGYPEDRIDWIPVRTLPERLDVLQQNRADMVVANFSITPDREQLVDFAGPYVLVPQAVLVRHDRTKPLETIADLRAPGVKVCTTTGSTSERALKEKGINPEPVDTNVECMVGLRSGRYDVFSTDLPVLAGLRGTERDTFDLLETAIADSSERIGIAVPNNDSAMRDLVAYFLDKWQRGAPAVNPWLRAYDRTIGPLLDPKYRSQPLVDHPPQLADFDSKAPQE